MFTDCVLLFFRFLLVKETQRVVAHKNNTKICRETGVQGQWGDRSGRAARDDIRGGLGR